VPDPELTTYPVDLGFAGINSSSVTNFDAPTGSTIISVTSYTNTVRCQHRVWELWNGSSATTTGINLSSSATAATGDLCHFIVNNNTPEAILTWSSTEFLSSSHTNAYYGGQPRIGTPRSPEEVARYEATRQRRLRDNARSRRFREAAEHRAENLLRSMLNAEQRDELERHGHFHVRAAQGRVYRVERGFQGNVKLIEGNHATKRYCIHADSRLPHADQMLAQKLMLENAEHDFLRIANMTRLRS